MPAKHFEYMLKRIVFATHAERDEMLLGLINSLGRDGWRVNNLLAEAQPVGAEAPVQAVTVILEHELIYGDYYFS